LKGKVTAVAHPRRPGAPPVIYESPLNEQEKKELDDEEEKSSDGSSTVTVNFEFQPFVSYHVMKKQNSSSANDNHDGRMSFGGRPMWTHFAFVDVFVDAFLAKNHSHYKNMSAGPPGVMGLSSALLFVTSVLKSLEKEVGGGGNGGGGSNSGHGTNKIVSKASEMLDDCSDLCNRFTMATNDPNRLYETILQVCMLCLFLYFDFGSLSRFLLSPHPFCFI
jgi:hypothetical protein